MSLFPVLLTASRTRGDGVVLDLIAHVGPVQANLLAFRLRPYIQRQTEGHGGGQGRQTLLAAGLVVSAHGIVWEERADEEHGAHHGGELGLGEEYTANGRQRTMARQGVKSRVRTGDAVDKAGMRGMVGDANDSVHDTVLT